LTTLVILQNSLENTQGFTLEQVSNYPAVFDLTLGDLQFKIIYPTFLPTVSILRQYKELIENTTYIVPPETLLAIFFNDGTRLPVVDQTVWTINNFTFGYFFGEAYTYLNGNPSSHTKLVGSITTLGDVFITFYPLSGSTNSTIVNGVGRFEKQNDGKYYFLMQMNSAASATSGLSHWSYMISVKPGDFFYEHLPGTGGSVTDFLAKF